MIVDRLDDRGAFVPPGLLDEPALVPCCYGAATSECLCTCWEPVYDLAQQPLENDGQPPSEIRTRLKCCGDCAYRQGSPERERGDGEWLEDLARAGDPVNGRDAEFWCHQGVRRVVAWRHPDGRELPGGAGDYRPPVGPEERPVVWRADGKVAERCAGWAALAGGAR